MDYKLTGGTAYPLAEITMNKGERIMLERGSMAYKQNVRIDGKMNANGKQGLDGLFSAIGRSMTSGESMFITEATATSNNALLAVAPANIGKIQKLEVGSKQYLLNTGAYLASDKSVNYRMVRQSLGKALFARTGGLYVMETRGQGDILISSFGDIIDIEVTPNNPLTVDNEHVLAWDANLNYDIEVASGMFGFTSGEGIVNTFRGTGTVLVQTRNIANLANALVKYLPQQKNN